MVTIPCPYNEMSPKDWPLVEMESRDMYSNNCEISLIGGSIFLVRAHITLRAIVSAIAEGLFDI